MLTPPAIAFQTAFGTIKFAYLVRIDGTPWAYADLREVHLSPDEAGAARLDPSLIEERLRNEKGDVDFWYPREIVFQ